MFDPFDRALIADGSAPASEPPTWSEVGDARLALLLRTRGGNSYGGGLYRIASASQLAMWNARLAEAFPSFAARVTCFGYDWLGRAFALDCKRMEGGHPGVVLLEPGTGEVLEIPGDLVAFHNRELIENREAALAESFFRSWLEAGGRAPDHGQCVGYKVPLFLGGKDVLENLELSDIDVYWSLTAQLLMAAKRVGTGARLGKASIDD